MWFWFKASVRDAARVMVLTELDLPARTITLEKWERERVPACPTCAPDAPPRTDDGSAH
jgi:hypothetical protein